MVGLCTGLRTLLKREAKKIQKGGICLNSFGRVAFHCSAHCARFMWSKIACDPIFVWRVSVYLFCRLCDRDLRQMNSDFIHFGRHCIRYIWAPKGMNMCTSFSFLYFSISSFLPSSSFTFFVHNIILRVKVEHTCLLIMHSSDANDELRNSYLKRGTQAINFIMINEFH